MANSDLHLCTCELLPYRHLHREECPEVCRFCKSLRRGPFLGNPRLSKSKPHLVPCGFCPQTFRTLIERNAHRNQEHRTF